MGSGVGAGSRGHTATGLGAGPGESPETDPLTPALGLLSVPGGAETSQGRVSALQHPVSPKIAPRHLERIRLKTESEKQVLKTVY